MVQETPQFDWHLCQNEVDWQCVQEADCAEKQDEAPSAAQRILGGQWSLIGCVILLLLLASWKWYGIRIDRNAAKAELRQTLLREERRPERSTQQAAESRDPLDPVISVDTDLRTPKIRIEQLDWRNDRALVHVTVRAAAPAREAMAYRETRVYQQTTQGWQRSSFAAEPELLGAWQTLETRHFVIRHRAIDAVAVAEVAARFDALYEAVRRDVGLPAHTAEPITVAVIANPQPDAQTFSLPRRTIHIPSPAALRIPAEWTDATVLHQALIYPLATFALWEMREQHSTEWQQTASMWQPMMSALRLWQLWESDGPLGAWRGDVVGWLYVNASSRNAYQRLPARYAELCRTYQTWKLFPLQTSIPLLCIESDPLDWYRLPQRLPALAPLREHSLGTGRPISGQAHPAPTLDQVIGLETVLEYVVATYGRNRLPVLMHALGHHTQWHSLVPEVFGVSAAEFEDGWQAYLAQNYR